jgi:hypothetical protein
MSSQGKPHPKRRRRKKKLKQSVNDFSSSLGLSPMRILGSIGLLIALGVLLYVVLQPENGENPAREIVRNEVEKEREVLSVDQIIDQMGKIDAQEFERMEFLVKMQEVDERLEKIEEVSQRNDLSAKQQEAIDRLKIQNLSLICLEAIRGDFAYDPYREKLIEQAGKFRDHPNKDLREIANFSLAVIETNEFTQNPSDESYENFQIAAEKNLAGFVDNVKNSKSLASMLVAFSKRLPNHPKSSECLRYFSQVLTEADNPVIKNLSAQLLEESVFGRFNIGTLKERITWSGVKAAEDLAGAVEQLAKHDEATMETWGTLIKAYEGYFSIDKIEEAGAAWSKVSKIASGVPGDEKRQVLVDILDKQRIRASKIGTPFDVAGVSAADGSSIEPDATKYTVVAFCDKQRESEAFLKKLKPLVQEPIKNFRIVLVFSTGLTEVDLKSLGSVPNRIYIGTDETSGSYFKQFPAAFFPYVILIDKQGKIVSANIDVDQVINRIAAQEAAARNRRNSN